MRLVLITGMSGAGKGVALRALEDMGFEAMDNLPLRLVEEVLHQRPPADLAIDLDIRSRAFSPALFLDALARVRAAGTCEVSVLFLECDDDALRKRYTETRRPHPLALDRPVMDGIALERSLIHPLRSHADVTIDTTETTPAQLRRLLSGHFGTPQGQLGVYITSFAFRHGLPREADMVFDVRFLRNPHYVDALRPKTGSDADVAAYVQDDPDFQRFFDNASATVLPLLPRYREEGKRYLTIAIGCTGGKHRSVVVATRLHATLVDAGYAVTLEHRDVARA